MKLWQGRFETSLSADADAFNESLSFDKKLYKADITASVAHATMLGECGIIEKEEAEAAKKNAEAAEVAKAEVAAVQTASAQPVQPVFPQKFKHCHARFYPLAQSAAH